MESRAKLFGHPIHQMLIVFPLGLLATALLFDVVQLVSGNGFWSELSYWMIAAGVISGLVAAPSSNEQSIVDSQGMYIRSDETLHNAGSGEDNRRRLPDATSMAVRQEARRTGTDDVQRAESAALDEGGHSKGSEIQEGRAQGRRAGRAPRAARSGSR